MPARPPSPLRAALFPIAILVSVFALSGSAARAATCQPELVDGAGVPWEAEADGAINEAADDTYDSAGVLSLSVNGDTLTAFPPTGTLTCTTEDDGRETRYPQATIGGMTVSRTLFVSPDAPFARELSLVTNPTAERAAVTAILAYDLGSDDDTEIVATSSGDNVLSTQDRWFSSEQGDRVDAASTIVFDGFGGPQRYRLVQNVAIIDPSVGDGKVAYDLSIGPGQTVALMQVFHSSDDRVGAVAFGRANGNGTEQMYAGLSPAERAALRNWPQVPDRDADGRLDPVDNCPAIANFDQRDADGDRLGDVCDPDADGDGLLDSVEHVLGLNAAAPDTDGDGTADGADRCPTIAARGGCPTATAPSAAAAPAAASGAPRSAALTAVAPRGLSVKATLRRGRMAVSGKLVPAAGRACAGTVRVSVVRGERVRATLSARVNADCTYSASKKVSRVGRRPLVLAAYQGADGMLGRVASARAL
jgi:hypothetical protein